MDLLIFALTAICVVFAFVAIATPVADRLRLPLPVVIGTAGLVYGSISLGFGFDPMSLALEDYDRWLFETLAFDNRSLLLIFLPPLLFEMALHVNVRRLVEDASVVVTMAVVAVIFATGTVGVLLWLVAPVGLLGCLLLGAAVSTTDPAAVITAFKQIGAPRRLLVILEGESLLNDAAAIALFSLIAGAIAANQPIQASSFVAGFGYAFGVGAATGFLMGWVVSRVFSILGGSAVAEMTMTVALAYGCYIVADTVLGASGVVAVVFASLAISTGGTLRMGPRNWRTMTRVWSQIGFWANNLILLLAATMAPFMLLSINGIQVLLIIVVYLAAIGARAGVLFGLLPLLTKLGLSTPITSDQKTLAVWGGVRGAVTLVLALSLADVPGLDEEDAELIAAVGAGYVFLTLLLNASTLAAVTRRLGLDRLSPGDLALRERIVAGAQEEVQEHVVDLARERKMDEAVIADMRAAYEPHTQEILASIKGVSIPFGERLRLGITIVASQELQLVLRAFEEGAVGPRTTRVLRANAERMADAARLGGREGYESSMQLSVRFPWQFRIASWIYRFAFSDWLLRELLARRLTMLLETETVVRELDGFIDRVILPMVGPDAAANLKDLHHKRLALVRGEIDVIGLQYPAYTKNMEVLLLMRAGARRERTRYDELFREGIIGQELHRSLLRELDQRMGRLYKLPKIDLRLELAGLVGSVPLFADLGPERLATISNRLRNRFAVPGEVVAARDARGSEMFFVTSGVLEVRGLDREVLLSNGDFFGELALIAPTRRRSTEIVARGFCRLLVLTRRDFKRLARKDPELERAIRKVADRQLDQGFQPTPRSPL